MAKVNNKRIIWFLVILLVCGLAVSALTVGYGRFPLFNWRSQADLALIAAVPNEQDEYDARRTLEDLVVPLSRLSSVQMHAKVRITVFGETGPSSGEAEISYAASGDKFRYEAVIPPELEKAGLMRSLSVAWDGEKRYLWDPSADVVSISKENSTNDPTAIPNAFFLPLEFLNVRGQNCPGCRIGLSDLANITHLRSRIEQGSLVQTEKQDGIVHYLYSTDGGNINGRPIKYLTRVIKGEKGSQINSISILDVENNPLGELVFGDFRWDDNAKSSFPYEVSMIARDEKGGPALLSVFRISSLSFNEEIDVRSFAVGMKEAGNVWDSDAKKFLREKKS